MKKGLEDQIINKLNNDYTPRIPPLPPPKKKNENNRVLESARKLSDGRNEFINLFEKRIFPHKDNTFKTKEEESEESEE